MPLRLAIAVIPHETSTTKNGMEGKVKRYAFSTKIDEKDNTPITAVSYTHLTLPTTPYV